MSYSGILIDYKNVKSKLVEYFSLSEEDATQLFKCMIHSYFSRHETGPNAILLQFLCDNGFATNEYENRIIDSAMSLIDEIEFITRDKLPSQTKSSDWKHDLKDLLQVEDVEFITSSIVVFRTRSFNA